MKNLLQPTLQSDLVVVRPLKEEDFDSLFAAANDPLIWEQHPNKRYKPGVFKAFFTESMQSGGALLVTDNISGEVIGSSRYKISQFESHTVEIGWTFLSRKYWGGKYNKALKNLMLDHAFTFAKKVIFYVAKNNFRSQEAVKKIGGIEIKKSENSTLTRPDHVTFYIGKGNRPN